MCCMKKSDYSEILHNDSMRQSISDAFAPPPPPRLTTAPSSASIRSTQIPNILTKKSHGERQTVKNNGGL
mgnify:CR=1 FL=1